MEQPVLPQRKPVLIHETTHFLKDVRKYWTEEEHRAAHLLFADRKMPGVASKELPGLRELTFAGAVVLFGVDESLDEVTLIHIFKSGDPVKNKSYKKIALDWILKGLKKGWFFYLTYEKLKKILGLPDLPDFPDIGDLF